MPHKRNSKKGKKRNSKPKKNTKLAVKPDCTMKSNESLQEELIFIKEKVAHYLESYPADPIFFRTAQDLQQANQESDGIKAGDWQALLAHGTPHTKKIEVSKLDAMAVIDGHREFYIGATKAKQGRPGATDCCNQRGHGYGVRIEMINSTFKCRECDSPTGSPVFSSKPCVRLRKYEHGLFEEGKFISGQKFTGLYFMTFDLSPDTLYSEQDGYKISEGCFEPSKLLAEAAIPGNVFDIVDQKYKEEKAPFFTTTYDKTKHFFNEVVHGHDFGYSNMLNKSENHQTQKYPSEKRWFTVDVSCFERPYNAEGDFINDDKDWDDQLANDIKGQYQTYIVRSQQGEDVSHLNADRQLYPMQR